MWSRRSLAAVLAVFIALPMLIVEIGSASPAPTPPAVSNLQTCVAQRHALDVVFLVDESGSLSGQGRAGTDPNAERVVGIKAALAGLSRLAAGGDGPRTDVHALLMGFASDVETAPSFEPGKVGPFQSVTPISEPALLSEAQSFAARDHNGDTDYRVALQAASTALSTRAGDAAATDGESACQAIVFFTDGGYNPPRDRAAGLSAMCRPGGITDTLRADGVILLTVFLSTRAAPGDLDFLGALTDGSGTSDCGTTASSATGLVISVADAGRLAFLLGDLIGGSLPPVSNVPGSFLAPPGVNRFVLDVQTTPNSTITLRPPGGGSTQFQSGESSSTTIAGTQLVATPLSQGFLEIVGGLGSSASTGTWRLEASGTDPVFTVELFSDVRPTLIGALPKVEPGVPTTLDLKLLTPQGQALPQGLLSSGAQITATLQESGAASAVPVNVTRTGDDYRLTVTVPATSRAATFDVNAAAALPAVEGNPVTAGRTTFTLARAYPLGTGVPVDTYLSFPTLRGRDPSTAEFHIRGGLGGDGCSWISSVDPVAPEAARGITVDPLRNGSRATCASSTPGQAITLPVTIHANSPASGQLTGTVTLSLVGVNGDVYQVTVPIRGRLDIKHNTGLDWLLVALFMIAGLLVSLLVLHVLNVWTALFIAPQRVRVRSIEVEVMPGAWVRERGTEALEIDDDPTKYELLKSGGRTKGVRRLTIGQTTLAAVASGSRRDRTLRPLKGPYGTAYAPGLVAGTDNVVLGPAGRGDRTAVSLDLHHLWLFVPSHADENGAVVGVLSLVIADVEPLAQRSALLRVAEAALPREVSLSSVDVTKTSTQDPSNGPVPERGDDLDIGEPL